MDKKSPTTHLKLFSNPNFLQKAYEEKEQSAG